MQGQRGDFLRMRGVRKCWRGNFLRGLRREMVDGRERLRIQRKMREDKGSLVYILLLLLLADGPMDKVDGR